MSIIKIIEMILILGTLKFHNINAKSDKDLLSKFSQHDYKMTFERLDLKYYDTEAFENVNVITFKYNRTTAVCNITVVPKINFDENQELTIIIQVYKFLSNEYRHFPIHFQVSFCNAYYSDMIGLSQLNTSGNFTTTCELKKGVTYHAYNFVPKEDKFPPHIPNGNFKLDFEVYLESKLILTLSGSSIVYRPM